MLTDKDLSLVIEFNLQINSELPAYYRILGQKGNNLIIRWFDTECRETRTAYFDKDNGEYKGEAVWR